jgi:glycosyltransferase involved in cell wall biosynthesis
LIATRTKRLLSIQPTAERGGSDQALVRMVGSLTADGWTCHIAVPSPSPLREDFAAAGATLHVVPMRRLSTSGTTVDRLRYLAAWPGTVWRLVGLARTVEADVIHSNSLHSLYGWAAAAVARRPHVWHAREIVSQSRAALALERWLARRFATTVVAVSAAVAAQLDPANVEIVTDEADPTRFTPARAGRFRAGAGIPDDAPLVGTVGRIDTWKGFDVLLDAVGGIRAARPDAIVVFAGPDVLDKEGYAKCLARKAGALPGVHWLGARSDVAELMADLDVFVLPSVRPEPFGLVVVEALASGVPVVATDAGGPPEILGPAGPDAGRLVRPADPAALAAAVIDLLPTGPSSVARRRARRPLRPARPVPFAAVFDVALAAGRRRPAQTRASAASR